MRWAHIPVLSSLGAAGTDEFSSQGSFSATGTHVPGTLLNPRCACGISLVGTAWFPCRVSGCGLLCPHPLLGAWGRLSLRPMSSIGSGKFSASHAPFRRSSVLPSGTSRSRAVPRAPCPAPGGRPARRKRRGGTRAGVAEPERLCGLRAGGTPAAVLPTGFQLLSVSWPRLVTSASWPVWPPLAGD